MVFDIHAHSRRPTHDDSFEPYPASAGVDDQDRDSNRDRDSNLGVDSRATVDRNNQVDRNAIDPRSSRVVRKWRHDIGRLWRRASFIARRDVMFASDREVGAIKYRIRRVARIVAKTLRPDSSLEREKVRRDVELALVLQRFPIGVVEASRVLRRDRTTVGRAASRGREALRKVSRTREKRRSGESA